MHCSLNFPFGETNYSRLIKKKDLSITNLYTELLLCEIEDGWIYFLLFLEPTRIGKSCIKGKKTINYFDLLDINYIY